MPKLRIIVSRVKIDRHGYDDGGSYWGVGQRLYAVESSARPWPEFIRAADVAAARQYAKEAAKCATS